MIASRSLALVSLGISCQTAHQLRTHKNHLGELTELRTPFDWLYCPIKSVIKMVSSGTFFPVHPHEFDGHHRPYWSMMDVHFWHESVADWSRASEKAMHVHRNWQSISDSARKVFLVSNTQNNVASNLTSPPWRAERRAYPPMDTAIHQDDLTMLHSVLAESFGRVELHVVTNERDLQPVDSVSVHHFQPDKTIWQGDDVAWLAMLKQICAS